MLHDSTLTSESPTTLRVCVSYFGHRLRSGRPLHHPAERRVSIPS